MDIFFTVTTFAVVAVAAIFGVLVWRAILLVAAVHRLTDEAVDEARALRADLGEVRDSVRREGFRLRHVLGLVTKIGGRLAGRGRRKGH